MSPPDAAVTHYADQAALAAATVAAVDEIWTRVDPLAIDATWDAQAAVERIAANQLLAATAAEPYVIAVLTELDVPTAALGRIAPRAFAGIASDGRPLLSLLHSPAIAAKTALGAGLDLDTAVTRGRYAAARIAGTQVADAGRLAVGTATVARPAVTHWVRMLNPPACARCAILAGRIYRWNQGFLRHPLCDCTHIPVSEDVAGDLRTDPKAYFDSLSAADQDRYFTAAGAKAIRLGGDMNQVVNARRGIYTTASGQLATRDATTRRGAFGRSELAAGSGSTRAGRDTRTVTARLMPEAILAQGRSRTETIELLRRFGFLT